MKFLLIVFLSIIVPLKAENKNYQFDSLDLKYSSDLYALNLKYQMEKVAFIADKVKFVELIQTHGRRLSEEEIDDIDNNKFFYTTLNPLIVKRIIKQKLFKIENKDFFLNQLKRCVTKESRAGIKFRYEHTVMIVTLRDKSKNVLMTAYVDSPDPYIYILPPGGLDTHFPSCYKLSDELALSLKNMIDESQN